MIISPTMVLYHSYKSLGLDRLYNNWIHISNLRFKTRSHLLNYAKDYWLSQIKSSITLIKLICIRNIFIPKCNTIHEI